MIGLKIWLFFKVGQVNCVLIFRFWDKSFFGYFIIKKENEQDFCDAIGDRLSDKVEVGF